MRRKKKKDLKTDAASVTSAASVAPAAVKGIFIRFMTHFLLPSCVDPSLVYWQGLSGILSAP